ncbi:MAG: HlyD family efflux transporter periplasmic adaptor subunit [Pseudomonadota bacterium]
MNTEMPPESSLFRAEVLDTDGKNAAGDVVLVYPVSNYFLLGFALCMLAVLLAFGAFGTYTRHASVAGVLEPTQGVVKLYASQAGVLKMSQVREGQQVHKGDILLVFESLHLGADGRAVEAQLDLKLNDRLNTLHTELDGTLKLQAADVAQMRQSLATQQSNLITLRKEMQTQQRRVQTAEQALARYESLQKAGFMSDIQVQQKSDEVLDQQMRLQNLQTSVTSGAADAERLSMQLAHSAERRQVAKAQIDRNISSTESELDRQQNEHTWTVVAPCDGLVASLTIVANQSASVGVPLVSIVPSSTQLQANLYAPSRALGFVRAGQLVKMKLDAFPYQKFGLVQGRVISVADSPVRPSESSLGNRLATSADTNEPLYAIRVSLDAQFVYAYGQKQGLRPGMQLDADIALDTRQLYEWVLEPLYSLRRG